ncbi:hypothetical protein JQC92_00825 [Shewanella sp. 202IG2-18]|uniref:hypothetical protein n=1 Tax=Parashewanella hymeniacidonis TaxID=2807618 RepID=UPI001961F89B|nr:hypothetical protein [Parashewanella hymeniacidonis]MBM7070588.1 hypothetical protein [Parashewanella hymeniacidonis]
MRFLKLVAVFFLLTGCVATAPTSVENASSQIEVEHDKFNGTTWIRTPLYLSRQGFTDTFPVKLMYRANYKKGRLEFIQLYVTATNVEWGFYHSANDQNGNSLNFVNVDNVVGSAAGMVTTVEHFGLDISKNYLAKMANENWQIKVYGKRKRGVFIVPQAVSLAFFEKLNCFESKKC